MMEACNTSFQLHFQVAPAEFAELYNLAQVVTGPVLAAAVNSPTLLGHRLWHETRIALFQQSVDVRSKAKEARGQPMRVSFGDRWVDDSILEIFREDIARFRVVIASELGEPSTETLARGVPPSLKALCLHNGTVYRWNRPCYGVKDGIAHLRIENRVLPAGPRSSTKWPTQPSTTVSCRASLGSTRTCGTASSSPRPARTSPRRPSTGCRLGSTGWTGPSPPPTT